MSQDELYGIVNNKRKHREYLTGFRKRRQQRREEGHKLLEQKLRREKIRNRKEVHPFSLPYSLSSPLMTERSGGRP